MEYRRRRKTLAMAAVLCAALFLAACPIGVRENLALLRIVCVVPDEISSSDLKSIKGNSIQPQSGCKIGSYRLTFTSKSGETVTKTLGRGADEVRLKPGEWDLIAEGLTADSAVILEKAVHLNAEAGKTISVPIQLHLARGTGGLELTFAPSQAPSPDWKYVVGLVYRGLPGDSTFSGPQPISYDIPASEAHLSAPNLPSGIYTMSVQLLDASSTVVAGTTATALIAAHQVSIGTCSISLTDPSVGISISAPLLELSVSAAMGVDRTVARGVELAIPLALPISETAINSEWYTNGTATDTAEAIVDDAIPGFTIRVATIDPDEALSSIRIDSLLSTAVTSNAQVFSTVCAAAPETSNEIAEWIQTIDYHAALNPSLVDTFDTSNTGTGISSPAKWVAANPRGLIAIIGMDKSSAVHLFYSPAKKVGRKKDGSSAIIQSSVAWLRLWRDRIVINGNERSPDNSAISPDGTRFAVAGSNSNWLRMYALDDSFAILSKSDILSGGNGFPTFNGVRAMRFSADAKLLYVLVNNPSKIFVLDVDKFVRGEMSVVSEFSMLECFEGQSVPSTTALGMTDLALLQDGWIAASSNDTARIYFIHYSEADAQFNAHSIFSTGPNGESLGDPRAIAYDPASGLCYILGYSKKLHIAAIKNPASDYSLISTIELDASLDKATSIAFAQNEYGSKVLGISGGAGLGMVSLDASGTPILQTSLLKTNESAAIASVKNICALSDTFITSGDATGLVSSFRLR